MKKISELLSCRLILMQLPLKNGNGRLINAYVLTVTNYNEPKDKFYEELDFIICPVP